MKKKTAAILLAVLGVTGSLVNFYAVNLLFSDLSNMFYGVHDDYIISSIPLFMLSVLFTAAFTFVLRYTRYPQYRKAIVRLYSVYLCIFSGIGAVFAILSGTHIYHDFLAPYPFAAYPLVMLILHAALFAAGIVIGCRNKKRPADPEKRHRKPKYILYSILLPVFTYFAENKLGALLFAPFYAQGRTLGLTLPFYVSLLLAPMLLTHIAVYFLGGYEKHEEDAIRNVSVIMALSLAAGLLVFVLGYRNTSFISAVSPALALERLAAFPVDTILQFAVTMLMSIYYLIYAIVTYKRARKENG